MKNKMSILAGLALVALAAVGGGRPVRAADSGDVLFKRYCSICHSTESGQNKVGPSLAGIVGRQAGDAAGFNYSTAMQSAGVTWDEKTLDQYLADPRAFVPGNKMLFPGVKNPDDRKAIIAYLKTLKS